jgi:hypothetical protein
MVMARTPESKNSAQGGVSVASTVVGMAVPGAAFHAI